MENLIVRHVAVGLSLVLVMVLGPLATSGTGSQAQEAPPGADHPIVGVWRFTNEVSEGITFPSLAIFHADGTYVEDYPDESSFSLGVWRPTGERTANLTVYQNYVIDDKLVNAEGRNTVEVDETGNAMTVTGTFVGLFEDGTVDIAVEGTSPATRLDVLPVVPLGELVPGGTPVIPADLTDEATPAP